MLRFACVPALVLLAASFTRAEVPISSCGQTLETGEVGVLQADMPGAAPPSVGKPSSRDAIGATIL